MIKTFLSALFLFVICPKMATAQVFDRTSSKPSRTQIIREVSQKNPGRSSDSISFKTKINDLRLDASSLTTSKNPEDRASQMQKFFRSGGESGGGGNLLEMKLTASLQKMYDGLKIKNQDGINLETLKFFIENTTIVLSSDIQEFYLKTDANSDRSDLRDAVNYFPKQWLLKLYAPAWEKYFSLNMDTEDLLYHEFLLFFFQNDKNYVRSKSTELGSSRRSTLTLVIGKASSDGDSNFIRLLGETLDRKETISIFCSRGAHPRMDFYYYRNQQALASTNNSAVNPFTGCDEFEEIKMKLMRASTICPVIVDLDRKSVDSGNIALMGIRTTCN